MRSVVDATEPEMNFTACTASAQRATEPESGLPPVAETVTKNMMANNDAARLQKFRWVSLPREMPNEALASFLTQHGASVYQETNFHFMVEMEKSKTGTDWEAVREQIKKKKRKHL